MPSHPVPFRLTTPGKSSIRFRAPRLAPRSAITRRSAPRRSGSGRAEALDRALSYSAAALSGRFCANMRRAMIGASAASQRIAKSLRAFAQRKFLDLAARSTWKLVNDLHALGPIRLCDLALVHVASLLLQIGTLPP